jgi:hypothetical protein
MRNIQPWTAVAFVLVISMLLAGTLLAAGESINRSAINSGGGSVNSGDVQLQASLGQPFAGTVSVGDNQSLCGGLFCGAGVPDTPAPPDPDPDPDPDPQNTIYLPTIKNQT